MDKLKPAAVAVVSAVVGALGAMGKAFVDRADDLSKMSQKAGVAVDWLSGLAHGADMSGVGMKTLGTSLTEFNKKIVEAATKGGESKRVFTDLGISLTDQNDKVKDTKTLFMEVAQAMSGFQDGSGKSEAATRLFGKAGADLIPLLNSGADGIAAMQVEAAQLGLTIDGQTAVAAEEFNDNLTRMQQAVFGLAGQVAAQLLPIFVEFTDWIIKTVNDTGLLHGAIGTLVDLLKNLFAGLIAIKDAFALAGRSLGAFYAALAEAATGNFAGARDILKGIIDDAKQSWDELAKKMADIKEPPKREAKTTTGNAAGDGRKEFPLTDPDADKKAREAHDKHLAEVNRFLGQLEQEYRKSTSTALELVEQEYQEKKRYIEKNVADADEAFFALKQLEDIRAAKVKEIRDKEAEDQKRKLAERAELERQASELSAEMVANQIDGAAALMAAEAQRHQARLAQIEELKAKGIETRELELQAEMEHQQALLRMWQECQDIKVELDAAYRTGDIERSMAALDTQRAQDMMQLQGRQEFIKQYQEIWATAHRSMASYAAEAFGTLQQQGTAILKGLATGTMTAKQAMDQLKGAIIGMFAEWIAQRLMAFALEKIMGALGMGLLTTSTEASATSAASLAAAWAPAATATLIATFGASGSAAALLPALMGANSAIAVGLSSMGAVAGIAHGGLDYVPAESTYVLQRGERILSPGQNEQLMRYMAGDSRARTQGEIVVQLGGSTLARLVYQMSLSGELQIDARAVV